ncbi:unnamed protein product [Symbiodinium necroappetens]|uniref:Uncharacterized protein n=1 Tax=Symbiodinium necroappetens TaxID=1628268 RepID=A0A812VQ75_9DINO|nr:unnamed protein product [Symbiodinium necroappetens]
MHCLLALESKRADLLACPWLVDVAKCSVSGGNMPRVGHGPATEERRLNSGLQTLPSGINAFPVARHSPFHRSINQKMPELWSDFSERGLPHGRAGTHERIDNYHGDPELSNREAPVSARPGQVVFVGLAEFDMDGRAFTGGEMDRMMMIAASQKYPCSRPATFDEYAEKSILGLPQRNTSGRDVVFVGPGATGCELFHTNTLGVQKAVVPPGDTFDGTWGAASLYGRKCILCVYPLQRLKKQQSLVQFGLARSTVGRSGRLRRAGSLASLSDTTQWTTSNFGASNQAQTTQRMDQFFR